MLAYSSALISDLACRRSSSTWTPGGPIWLRLRLTKVTSDRLFFSAATKLISSSSVTPVFLSTSSTSSDVFNTSIMASSCNKYIEAHLWFYNILHKFSSGSILPNIAVKIPYLDAIRTLTWEVSWNDIISMVSTVYLYLSNPEHQSHDYSSIFWL